MNSKNRDLMQEAINAGAFAVSFALVVFVGFVIL